MAQISIAYYVDAIDGDNSNDGKTLATPKQTIEAALHGIAAEPTIQATLVAEKNSVTDPDGSEYLHLTINNPALADTEVILTIYLIKGFCAMRALKISSSVGSYGLATTITVNFIGGRGSEDGLNPPHALIFTVTDDSGVYSLFWDNSGNSYTQIDAIFKDLRVAYIGAQPPAALWLSNPDRSGRCLNCTIKNFLITYYPTSKHITAGTYFGAEYSHTLPLFSAKQIDDFGDFSCIQAPEDMRAKLGAFLPPPPNGEEPSATSQVHDWIDDITYLAGRPYIPTAAESQAIYIQSGTGCRVLSPVTDYQTVIKISTVGIYGFEVPALGDVIDSTPLDSIRTIEVRGSLVPFSQDDTTIPWVTWIRDSLNAVVEGRYIQFRVTLLDSGEP